nr:MAG TPA: endonuclease-like protein [Caudoviricetes sp.]
MNMKQTTQDFIEKARKVHGDKYDYSCTEYKGARYNVDIRCKIHGVFTQIATNHLGGKGCTECSKIKVARDQTSNTEEFIKKARNIHGDKYDYSLVDYKNNRTQVEIICTKHGSFLQTPSGHLSGKGCIECGKEKSKEDIRSRIMLSKDEFIKRANNVHKNLYDYSKIEYVDTRTKIKIVCKKHGLFLQTPQKHMMGRGCPTCGRERTIEHNFSNTQDFIKKAKLLHGDLFGYKKVDYRGADIKIEIICKKHGSFFQSPHNHLKGTGCPRCGVSASKFEIEIVNFIKTFYCGEIITNSKDIIPPMELDIFLPEFNLGIEINGMYWHSEKFKEKNYHLHKYNLCKDKGIRLISIWEWEIIKDKDKIENFIKNLISEKIKLQARKLQIRNVNIKEQKSFLKDNHLQGYVPCSLALGLYFEDELIQIMTLRAKDKKNKIYEIGRLATKIGYSVIGGAERLFKNLLSYVDYTEIISYNNLDKFTGEVYERLGLSLKDITIPYGWISDRRFVPRYQTQKNKLIKQGFDKNKSESEIMRNEGFSKIYLTGVQKFVLKNKNSFVWVI